MEIRTKVIIGLLAGTLLISSCGNNEGKKPSLPQVSTTTTTASPVTTTTDSPVTTTTAIPVTTTTASPVTTTTAKPVTTTTAKPVTMTTAKPVTTTTAKPVTTTTVGSIKFSSCAAARAAGYSNIKRGEPGYSSNLDRDNDGLACDK